MYSKEKRFILNILFDLLSKQIPLPEAKVMVLGGVGREIEICQERGIAEANLIIVERSPRKMRKLMRRFPSAYTLQGDINKACCMLAKAHGPASGVDYIHLDLCGTLDPVGGSLESLIQLIGKSRGCSIAITVADQRVNLAHQTPEATVIESYEYFGYEAARIWHSIQKLHAYVRSVWNKTIADPEKVALRELSIYMQIARACGYGNQSSRLCPDILQRYIFTSGGFRMRTYFLHFSVSDRPVITSVMQTRFTELILASPCTYLIDENLIQVESSATPQPQEVVMNRKEEVLALRQKLSAVENMVNQTLREALERLYELAMSGGGSTEVALCRIESVISEIRGNSLMSEELKAAQNTSSSDSPDLDRDVKAKPAVQNAPKSSFAKPKAENKKVKPAAAGKKDESKNNSPVAFKPIRVEKDLARKDKVRLSLLAACIVEDPEKKQAAMDKATAQAEKMLEIESAENKGDQLRGIFARAQGKFRAEFVARQLLQHPEGAKRDEILECLAGYYKMSAADLLAEARERSIWHKAYSHKSQTH